MGDILRGGIFRSTFAKVFNFNTRIFNVKINEFRFFRFRHNQRTNYL